MVALFWNSQFSPVLEIRVQARRRIRENIWILYVEIQEKTVVIPYVKQDTGLLCIRDALETPYHLLLFANFLSRYFVLNALTQV